MSNTNRSRHRDESVGGPPSKRADALLLRIERRTARLAQRTKREVRRFGADPDSADGDLPYFEAFGAVEGSPQRPTVQQLERFATRWADIVPRNPRVQAAVARALTERHVFSHAAVPALRAALGLDDPAVRRAFQRMYGRPLESVYTERLPIRHRLRWAWAGLAGRVEQMPPFWAAYAVTLTETAGANILALPIAIAGVGPLGGLVVLVVLGLVNMLTVAYMCEAVAVSGPMRYGGSYLGRLLDDLLGPSAAAVVSMAMLVLCVLLLPAYYIGVASTLAAATPVPPGVWVAVVFAVNVAFLRRGVGATVAGATVVGAVNVGLILALTVTALPHLRLDLVVGPNVPWLNGGSFDSAVTGLVFGVTLSALFGHTSAVLSGQLVLPRDPGGRALVRGAMAALATTIVLYGLFVVSVGGAVDPAVLAEETGTALSPLADVAGPVVLGLGSVLVILAMGLGSVHLSMALFSMVRERLPAPVAATLTLQAGRGRLVLRPRARRRTDVALVVTYRGLTTDGPVVRVEADTAGVLGREDVILTSRWQLTPTDSLWPDTTDPRVASRSALALQVLEADAGRLRMRVTTTMRLAFQESAEMRPVGVGELMPDSTDATLAWMLRDGPVDAVTLAERQNTSVEQTTAVLDDLVRHGKVVEHLVEGVVHYTARVRARSGRRLPGEISDPLRDDEPPAPPRRGPNTDSMGAVVRSLVAASPIVAALAVTEWMVLTGHGSFTGILGFAGALVMPLLAGVIPALLVAAGRRRGLPASARPVRAFAGTAVLVAVHVLFVGGIAAHGLVIWRSPWQRLGALVLTVAIVIFTVAQLRSGALRRRLTVEVRGEARDGTQAHYRVALAGRPVSATAVVDDGDEENSHRAGGSVLPGLETLRRVIVTVPPSAGGTPDEIKVWAHRVDADGRSLGLDGTADIEIGGRLNRGRLRPLTGERLVPVDDPADIVTVVVARDDDRPTYS